MIGLLILIKHSLLVGMILQSNDIFDWHRDLLPHIATRSYILPARAERTGTEAEQSVSNVDVRSLAAVETVVLASLFFMARSEKDRRCNFGLDGASCCDGGRGRLTAQTLREITTIGLMARIIQMSRR